MSTCFFEPVDLGKLYIHLLKALKEKNTHYLKIGLGGENIWCTLYYFRFKNPYSFIRGISKIIISRATRLDWPLDYKLRPCSLMK